MKPLTRINMTGLLNPFAQYTDTFKNAECYYRNGTVSVGNTPAARCNITWVDAGNGTQVNGTVTYNYTCPTGYKCGGASPSAIPGQNGTYALDGVYWLCGHKLYAQLPVNWGGVCTLVKVTDHTFLIRPENATEGRQRKKRSLQPDFEAHDSKWGSNVPDEFKLWSTSNKVVLSLFPQFGVGKLMLRMETLDYRFNSFVNMSIKSTQGTLQELRELRAIIIQIA